MRITTQPSSPTVLVITVKPRYCPSPTRSARAVQSLGSNLSDVIAGIGRPSAPTIVRRAKT